MRAQSLSHGHRGSGRALGARVGWSLLVMLLVVEIASIFFLSDRGRIDSAGPTTTASDQEPAPPDGVGYTFDRPQGWTAEEEGTTTILTNADSSIVISLGLMAGEDRGDVADRVLSLLTERYRRVRSGEPETEGASLTVRGRALNSDQVQLRFRSTTMAAAGACNHQVIAFFGIDVDRDRVDEVVDGLLSTLELTGGDCPSGISA